MIWAGGTPDMKSGWGVLAAERIKTVKEALAASPPPRPSLRLQEKNIPRH